MTELLFLVAGKATLLCIRGPEHTSGGVNSEGTPALTYTIQLIETCVHFSEYACVYSSH